MDNETIASSLESFVEDFQANRIELSKEGIYSKFPIFRNAGLQMALVDLVQSLDTGGAVENLMREDVKRGLKTVSNHFGVELIISALQDDTLKGEIAKGLQSLTQDTHQLDSLKTSLQNRFNELKVKFLVIKSPFYGNQIKVSSESAESTKTRERSESPKKHVTFGDNTIVEIESDKKKSSKKVDKGSAKPKKTKNSENKSKTFTLNPPKTKSKKAEPTLSEVGDILS